MLTRVYVDGGRAWLEVAQGERRARVAAGGGLGRGWLEGIAEGLRLQGALTEGSFWAAIVYAMGGLEQ